ncbi:hypothetical protein, partial [Heyndrickxia ginsengihumi]|uniref:hypothetical protein n=1 Tax=Heyndrickxia ginsengihumi TaxID=363870 RepID=UPI0020404312
LILSEVVLIFYSKIIKAGEILRQVKFHRLFHFRDGFCPNLFIFFKRLLCCFNHSLIEVEKIRLLQGINLFMGDPAGSVCRDGDRTIAWKATPWSDNQPSKLTK